LSTYPTAIDDAASLYTPVDALSSRTLQTTASVQILAGDSSISVASAAGFADAYGILSIDDELVFYTARNASQFTGCQRGAFGTVAAQHALGATVRANMVSGFLTALQAAVVAIETELGTVAARNYVRATGNQAVAGVKTFQDGVDLGAGTKAATGLARMPNAGAVKWRKADDSGDIGLFLNASDHIVFDAVVEFATGQTFGAFSYPDGTTTSKGIVQVEATGGVSVAAGVISLAASGVTPGTYPKVTVDAKGRVTNGVALAAIDLPGHTHLTSEISSGAFGVLRGGTGLNTIAAGKMLYSPSDDTLAELSVGTGLTLGNATLSLASHTHAQADVTGLVNDLAAKAALAGATFTGAVAVSIGASSDDPFTVSGDNSNLGDHTLLKVLNNGELIIAGGTGNGYRLADLGSVNNPSGWAGVLKVKTPSGTTLGYILLYTNP